MDERELRVKVIKGLECCTAEDGGMSCAECPYRPEELPLFCRQNEMMRDALAMLKAQEPRVMTVEELPGWDGAFLIETSIKGATVWASWYAEYEQYGETVCRMVDIGGEVDDRFKKLYGYEWRCWTARPTDEQREMMEWDK